MPWRPPSRPADEFWARRRSHHAAGRPGQAPGALGQARAAAAGKDVNLMGADIVQPCLREAPGVTHLQYRVIR